MELTIAPSIQDQEQIYQLESKEVINHYLMLIRLQKHMI